MQRCAGSHIFLHFTSLANARTQKTVLAVNIPKKAREVQTGYALPFLYLKKMSDSLSVCSYISYFIRIEVVISQ